MRDEYDFSGMNSRPNPYINKLKKSVTIRLDPATIDYFKTMAVHKGIPYQTLIDLYLRDCVASKRRLNLSWDTVQEKAGAAYTAPASNPGARRATTGAPARTNPKKPARKSAQGKATRGKASAKPGAAARKPRKK